LGLELDASDAGYRTQYPTMTARHYTKPDSTSAVVRPMPQPRSMQ
jgi:hypothetical protein